MPGVARGTARTCRAEGCHSSERSQFQIADAVSFLFAAYV